MVGAIKGEQALSSKKFSDLAAGRPLTSEATHKRRYAARLEVTMKVRNIKEFGDGSPKDQLEKLVALTEKME